MGMRDLGTPVIRLMGREHPYLTGDQKTQRVDGVPDPADVGDDGDALPLREVFDADAEVFPRCAGEAATDLVIEPDLVVPLIASFGTLTAAQGGRFFESLPCPECMRRVYRVGNPETAAKRIPTATAPQRPMGCSGSIQVSSGRSAE